MLVTAAFLQLAAVALTSTYSLEGLHLPPDQAFVKTEVIDGQNYAKLGGIASTSVVVITLFAPLVGFLLYRKGLSVRAMGLVAMAIALVTVLIGFEIPVTLDPKTWMIILSLYMVVAVWVPVWVVLQPRDFVNVHFLYIGLAGMMVGIVGSGLHGISIEAPAFNITGETVRGLGFMWPFLFVTIACGACSGAHCLIASGTTFKQLLSEKDALFVGYGAMIFEAVLGICVTLVIISGLGFAEYRSIVWPQDPEGNFLAGNARSPLRWESGHRCSTVWDSRRSTERSLEF